MTREDAVTTLKDISEMVHKQKEIEKSTLYGILDSNNEPIEALDMAIKALEQEPCEDCISRVELLKAVDTWDKFGCDADSKLVPIKDCYVPYIHYDDVVKAIKGMPSIQPTTKENLVVEDCISRKAVLDALNKWDWQELYLPIHFKDMIDDLPSIQPKTGHWIENECSECGIINASAYKNYCPNCGAKMLPADSEKER